MLKMAECLVLTTAVLLATLACCMAEFSQEEFESRPSLKAVINSLLTEPSEAEYLEEKRGSMGFYGSRGKKALGFLGSRGKKAPSLGFMGSRGKRAEDDYIGYEDSQDWAKRGTLGFAGSRGKRTPYKNFMLSRGRG